MVKKKRKRASSSNRRGMAGIALVVFTLLSVLLMQSHRLEAKNTAYASQQAQLEVQIAEEEARADEIAKLPEYTQSKEYIEKVAREKFGLVYEDEIIFQKAE
ncbi:MAG: septum formation initiator family protein [Lachnospiraceae bacterium]|nr:septum formation initiator family protein [Lachnospiraceae bacterium]MDD3795963.1 septum formation initiator family protein [Lachnospiraceae bacterium]